MKTKMVFLAFCMTIMFCMSACAGTTKNTSSDLGAVTEISASENNKTESPEENVTLEGTIMYHTEEIWCENGNKKIYGNLAICQTAGSQEIGHRQNVFPAICVIRRQGINVSIVKTENLKIKRR